MRRQGLSQEDRNGGLDRDFARNRAAQSVRSLRAHERSILRTYLRRCWISHAEPGLGTVIANISIDFLHEIKAGQLTLVQGAVTRVGTKSFDHELRLYEADSMTHCATQRSVEVCFDTQARKAIPLPDDLKDKLAARLITAE